MLTPVLRPEAPLRGTGGEGVAPTFEKRGMSALPRGPPAKRGKSHQILQKYYRIITKILNLEIKSVLRLQ